MLRCHKTLGTRPRDNRDNSQLGGGGRMGIARLPIYFPGKLTFSSSASWLLETLMRGFLAHIADRGGILLFVREVQFSARIESARCGSCRR